MECFNLYCVIPIYFRFFSDQIHCFYLIPAKVTFYQICALKILQRLYNNYAFVGSAACHRKKQKRFHNHRQSLFAIMFTSVDFAKVNIYFGPNFANSSQLASSSSFNLISSVTRDVLFPSPHRFAVSYLIFLCNWVHELRYCEETRPFLQIRDNYIT